MDIREFLTARLDEIENALTHLPKRAREGSWELNQQGVSAQGGSRGRSVPWAIETRRDSHSWFVAERMDRSIAEYIAAVADPARLLADITAKRHIISTYSEMVERVLRDVDEAEDVYRPSVLLREIMRDVLCRLAEP